MLRNKSLTAEITGKLAHESQRGNMQKLFDGIRTPLKRFLACLTFHRKEILLCHLHKRTNPGSGSDYILIELPSLKELMLIRKVHRKSVIFSLLVFFS